MPNPSRPNKPLAEIDKLERSLARLLAAEKRKFKNEDIVRLEKNGSISYESIRTTVLGENDTPVREGEAPAEPPPADAYPQPSPPDFLPHLLPEPPVTPEIGNLIDAPEAAAPAIAAPASSSQPKIPLPLTSEETTAASAPPMSPHSSFTCHDTQNPGNQTPPTSGETPPGSGVVCGPVSASSAPDSKSTPDPLTMAPDVGPPATAASSTHDRDPLEELLHRALAAPHVRLGRPPAFDERTKGQLIALLSVGISMRQAAAVLGVSHTTVQNALKAEPALHDQITAARFQAQLQPLACVIREARRSWKAATWLLKYFDHKLATHEETPDEFRARWQRETEEFHARAHPSLKRRRKLS